MSDAVEFPDLDDVIELHDGNTRLDWLATAVFSDLNGAGLTAATNDAVYSLVIAVAADRTTIDEIAKQLERLHESRA